MLTVGRYFKQKFGFRVRKIPISLSGFTCPNIDGSVAKGGCIYCKNESFSPSLVMKKKQKDSKMETNIESKFQDSKEKLGNIESNSKDSKIAMQNNTESNDHKNLDSIQIANLDSKISRHTELLRSESEVSKITESAFAQNKNASTFATLKSQHDELNLQNLESRFYKTNEIHNLDSKKVTESKLQGNSPNSKNENMESKTQDFIESNSLRSVAKQHNSVRSTQPCESRLSRGVKNRNQGDSSVAADFSQATEKRGSPPLSKKSGCFFAQRGSGEGDLRFFAQESPINQPTLHDIQQKGFEQKNKDLDSKENIESTNQDSINSQNLDSKNHKDSKEKLQNIESNSKDSKIATQDIESSDKLNLDSMQTASLDSKENTESRFYKTNEFNNLESKKVTESTNSQNLDSKENTESMQNMQQKFAAYHHPHPPTLLEEKQRISAAYSSSSNKTQNLDSKNHKDSKEKLQNIESNSKDSKIATQNIESSDHKNQDSITKASLDSKENLQNIESNPKDSIKPKKITMNFKLTHNPLLERQLHELETQFEYHSKYHKNKFGISKYLVYFQSFTNTYAPFDTLKSLYTRALSLPDVVGMSIGTRVDCVDSRLLDFLGEFVKQGKEIWLEYGIQSIYEETLKLTNRGHTMQGVEKLFKDTRARGIKVCAHLIYGLPKESVEMMINSLKTILNYGVDSLKIHPLYVVEGTALARMYKRGEYEPISLETYGEAIAHSLKLIPPNVVVQRVSAGAHDDTLIAPKWCFDKNIQMRYLRERLKKEGIEY